MANNVYKINKGINKTIEFKGLRAQYIWYMGIVVLVHLLVFIGLYITGINSYLIITLVGASGFYCMAKVYALSKKFGEHGIMKLMAQRGIPQSLKINTRKVFTFQKKGNR